MFLWWTGEIHFCPKAMTFDGQCPLGSSGRGCSEEMHARLGAGAMPQNCTCTNISTNQRKCTCQVNCGI